MKLYRISTQRSRIKETGSMKIPMPASSPYIAVYVFSTQASQLYGAGTKWCTTTDDELFPNLVYFIHKTNTIDDDPEYYKMAIWVQNLFHSPPDIYRYDAQNCAMPYQEMLDRLNISSFDNILRFLRLNYHTVDKTDVRQVEERIEKPVVPSECDPNQLEFDFTDGEHGGTS